MGWKNITITEINKYIYISSTLEVSVRKPRLQKKKKFTSTFLKLAKMRQAFKHRKRKKRVLKYVENKIKS